ncbi:MAG: LPD38 domain-containing protein [Clostridia bacterium]|jgi:hypothetical protein
MKIDLLGLPDQIDLSGLPDNTPADTAMPKIDLSGLPDKEHHNILSDIAKPFVVQGEKAAEMFNTSMAGFSDRLDKIATYISDKTGAPKGGIFESAAKIYTQNADFWREKAAKNGVNVVDEIVGAAVGGAVPGIGEFMLNTPYAALTGAAEAHAQGKSEIVGAVKEGFKRAILGKAFEAGNQLKQPLAGVANAAVFGTQAATEGGTPADIAKSAVTGALYSVGSKGKMGVEDLPGGKKLTEVLKSERGELGQPAGEGKVTMYHQSQNPTGEFIQKGDKGYKKAGYSQAGEGIYFSPSKELVQSKYGKSGGKLVEANLDIKNPLDLGDKDAMYFDGRKVNYGDIVVENFKRYQQGKEPIPEPDIILQTITPKAKKWLIDNGYDAVTGMKGEMWSAPETVVFNKSQIKLSTPTEGKVGGLSLKSERGSISIPQTPLTPSEQYAQEQIIKREEARKTEAPNVMANISNFYKDAKAKLVDFAAPIEDVLKSAEKKGKYEVRPEEHITNQIDRVLRSPTIAGQFARDNGLVDVIQKVDNLNNLDQYLIAKQAQTVEGRGIKTGRDLAKDAQLIQDFAPKYEASAKVVNDYSKKLLDYSVESGLISADLAMALKIRYPDYVPLNRVFNELERTGYAGTKAIASLSKQTIVQKIIGSEREIENPLTSLLQKTNEAFKQGEKNKAARMLAGYKDLPGNPFRLKELAEGEHAQHTVSFLDNGVKKTFETTPEIATAAKSLNVQHLNILGQIFAAPVRIARIGITGINLPFLAANIAKDQVTAVINSKNALKTSIANPAVFTQALFEAVGHGKVYQEMGRQGVLGTSFDIARNQPELTLAKIRSGRNPITKIAYTVRHPGELLRAVENIVNRGEEMTRAQQYIGTKQTALEKGMSEEAATIEASRASRENTVNFARRGEWGTVLNSSFLYINANIQGTRTFLRNFHERPIQTAGKIALVVFTPVALATAWNLSDEKRKKAYMDIDEATKQNNIVIIPPNPVYHKDTNTWDIIKIPLSQEINNIAGMARRPIEAAAGLNPMVASDIIKAFGGTVSPISSPSALIPQALKPTIEAAANKSFFTGRSQVPYSMEKLSPQLQAKPYTAGTARKIGEILKVSPIKAEEWIRGTFGGVGSQVLHASDVALAKLNIIPKDQIHGQSVAKAILARFAEARGGHLEDAANEKLKRIIQVQADENFRLKQEAEILYQEFKTLPNNEAQIKAKELKKVNLPLYEKLKSVADDNKKGLDYNDRLMMQLQVKNGQRAEFIWQNLQSLETNEEKQAYYKELRTKKIISDEVRDQIKAKIRRTQKPTLQRIEIDLSKLPDK